MDAVQKRYQLSNYLIDPNCHRFRTVTRILGIVMTFIKKLRQRRSLNINQNPCKQLFVSIEDNEIKLAEEYYFKKCTTEVIHFMEKKTYEKFTKMKNGILFYSGRTLSTNDITVVGRYTNAMKDLTASTFHVPVIEKSSPVAYAIVSEIHWYHPTAKHCGIETTLRYVLQKAFIIEGRSIVKAVKKSCERCRYLEKRTVAVSMGPVSRHNLTIAPTYFASQVDLAGPFLSYSNHNKRATVKIWLVIFCCAVTSSTNIKVMEDYSTTSFIQAFTRFSCEVGYPHTLLCDEGSQLLKACQDMKLCFRDIHYQLHKDVKVKFEVCSVGGHNEHGKVERKIKEVKSSLEKTLMNERLSTFSGKQ